MSSLRNLAESLGLSTSTVSRALNGYADVNAQTRERIQEAANRIGYRPNGMAVRLATGRTDVFALVTTAREGGTVDSAMTGLIAGMSEVLAPRGKTIVAASLPMRDEINHFRALMRSGLFDGYVLARTRPHDARVDLLRAAGGNFLTYGRTHAGAHPWVDVDSERAFYEATHLLVSLGHTRIALVNGPQAFTFSRYRFEGFQRAMRDAQLPIEPHWVSHVETNAEAGFGEASVQFQTPRPPTAFLCATDSLALGVIGAARAHGKVPGNDVSVIGYGNTELAGFVSPTLSSIAFSTRDIGQRLANGLLQMSESKSPTETSQLCAAKLVLRGSHGPAPK